jgi:hypothetical protein
MQTFLATTGYYISACGVRYFVSSTQVRFHAKEIAIETNLFTNLQFPYPDAASFCCSYGLKVASFETLAEQNCVLTEAKSKKDRLLSICTNKHSFN